MTAVQAVRLPAKTKPTPANTEITPAAVGIQTVWSSWELTCSGSSFTTGLVSVQVTRLKNSPPIPSTIKSTPNIAIGFMALSCSVGNPTSGGHAKFPMLPSRPFAKILKRRLDNIAGRRNTEAIASATNANIPFHFNTLHRKPAAMPQPSVIHATARVEKSYAKPVNQVFAAFSDPAKKRRWYAERQGH